MIAGEGDLSESCEAVRCLALRRDVMRAVSDRPGDAEEPAQYRRWVIAEIGRRLPPEWLVDVAYHP